ncbi:MAG: D-alanyl-D-alanine carboxypeptidase/D-alanyl-D-alanine-endopeptidase [Nitriliruptor sp.]
MEGSDGSLPVPSEADDDPAPVPTQPPPAEARQQPGAVPEPVAPPPASRAALSSWLESILADASRADPDLELGVLVVDELGREVVALQPDRPMLPASTQKQVTAAAVLATLGADARLRTVVDATSGIAGDGTLDGDLLLRGTGDPTLVTEEYARFVYPARPRTSLDELADHLVELGLRRVTGRIRGSAPGFAPPALPSGWRDAYLDSLDGRYLAGLTVDGGLVTRLELPGIDPPPEREDRADGDGPDEADTEASGGPSSATPDPPVNVLDQLAALQTDQPPTLRTSLAADPVEHTVAELTRLLRERGVIVAGEPTTDPTEAPVAARLATLLSPPMADVLRFTVQRSDNHLADTLALVVARTRTREGSWETVPRAMTQVLERLEVPTEGTAFADGSGLSRDDRLTARALTELDLRLTGSVRFGPTWRSLQSVAGSSGTLRSRYVGTPAEGRFLGKTGSLRDVSSITGQILSAPEDPMAPSSVGSRRYHLTVLGNAAVGEGRALVRATVDELVTALVADLDGCRLELAGDEGPLGRPPAAARCGED